GPRQTGRFGMVIPRFVQQALRGDPITVYGDGRQSRCFTDVSDVVAAVVRLSQEPRAIGEVFNIGHTEEVAMLDLARRVKTLAGSTSEVRLVPYEDACGPGFEDMVRRIPDLTKIRQLLGYRPVLGLDDILRRVI